MKKRLLPLFLALFLPHFGEAQGLPISTPTGLWEFNNSASIGQATIGSNLTIAGTTPTYSASVSDGTKTLTGVITTVVGPANRLVMQNPVGANGGGTFTNEYTLLFDILSPAASRSSWRCLFQTNGSNSNDGDYFIRNSDDKIGIASPLGYSTSSINDSAWTRLVLVCDINATGTASTIKAYVNGTLFYTHNFTGGLNGTYGLGTTLLLFADDTSENAALNVGAVAYWGKLLTAAEITALGGAGATIQGAQLPNSAPVITQGDNFSMPDAALNGAAVTGTLNVTDADGDAITWSMSTASAHGTASITSSSNSQATISYTPAAGFTGVDTFTIKAADASANDTIAVTVVVRDPNSLLWPAPVGLWEFDSPFAPTVATIGSNLTAQGTGFTSATGAFTDDGAQQKTSGSNYLVANPVGANGGGTYSNRYTLLWDVFIPTDAAGQWKSLLQTNAANASGNDGDLFINLSGAIGTSGGLAGYSANTLSAGNWYRVVLRVINGQTNGATIWVNGVKWYTNTTSGGLDGRYGLDSTFLLFADDNGEDTTINYTNAAIWNDALSDNDIISLGNVSTGRLTKLPRPSFNHPPVITEGDTASLAANLNAPTPITFNATDADNDAITWSVSGAASHGTAAVTTSTSGQATITYTPALNYAGTDTFTVRAADASLSDSIVVSVLVQNGPPVIAEGDSYNLSATKNGSARSVTFNAADPDLNPLTWSISAPASHGTALVAGNNNTQGIITYAPATDYSGPDSFTVTVTDGALSDSIIVNVTVTDPVAKPKLTIVAAHGTATPVSGVYTYTKGTALTNSVTDEIGTTTRYTCTGWFMTGDSPTSGTAKTMNMTLTRDSVLTWNFRTEYSVQTAVSGTGTISVSSGWYEAGKPLQITATPGAGQYFAGWTGDTSGCQTGGKNIVIPMDRPRSTITATFVANSNFTFIALPDTQNYTSLTSPTDLYAKQTQWILDNKVTMNIKFVTHLGDVVNSPSVQSQWQRATDAMNLMNNKMPYGTCPGNHDLASGNTDYLIRFGPNPTHTSSVGRWIDPASHQTYSWYGGSSPRGYSSYQIVTVNGRDFMFLHMDMDACDQDLAWAAGVLAAHPKTLTMVTTHNYLAESGGSGTYGSGTGQRGYTAQANIGTWSDRPDTNRPLDVFNAIVKPYNQVYMVICGHNFATYNIQHTNDAGKSVAEVLVDWQSLPNGGNAFLRIMEFQPAQNRIQNTSYSPYLGRYVDPTNSADHQGMLDLHDPYGSEFTIPTDFDTRFNTNLTIASAYGGVTPAVGTYSIETGTPVAVSAADQIVGQTRYRATGWTLSGGQTASGQGNSATITQGASSTLTWNYATEQYLTTASTGSGIVSINSGWYPTGTVVNVQAQPDVGATFTQWSGDIAGCTINGATISVTMDRPRGPITAQFSSPLSTYSVEVASAYPDVTPAPATYAYEQGHTVTFTAADILGTDTRRVCTGYSVTGAITQSGPEKTFDLAITGNVTVTWNWKTQYLLTTAANGPGTVSTGSGVWVDADASVSVNAVGSTGAALSSWSGDTALGSASGNQFNIPAMTRPAGPLTANFAASMYTLTVVSSQSTTTPAVGTYTYAYGTKVDFSALSAESAGSRQRPTSWTLSGATTSTGVTTSDSFVISGNTTLTWSFAPEVLLTITSGAEGAVLPMDAAGWHPLGSTVSLQAVPPSLFTFRGWTGDVPSGSTNASLDLAMTQARTITADFKPQTTANGTPYWWLRQNTTVVADNYEAAGLNDIDGDGYNADQEFLAGTSDLDANDRLQVRASSTSVDGTKLNFTLPAHDGRLYQLLESATRSGPYTPVGAPVIAVSADAVISIPKPTGSPRYYSLQVSLGAYSVVDADPVGAAHMPLPGSVLRKMVDIPAGFFVQGETTGPLTTRPEHSTRVSAFRMDKFEVTRADWEAIATWAQGHGYDIPVTLRYNQPPYNLPGDHPAVAVSWYDAVKWCNARSEMEGRHPVYYTDAAATAVYRTGQIDLTAAQVNWAGDGYRLPTESEWERASRGGVNHTQFPWGDADSTSRANHWDYQVFKGRAPDGVFPYTERVGYFDGTQFGGAPDMANAYGLYDMAGNAWEWAWDRMSNYSGETEYNPRGPDSGTNQRIQRGGSWWNYIDEATNYTRVQFPPDGSDDYGMVGFRCVRAVNPNEDASVGASIASAKVAVSAPFSLAALAASDSLPVVTLVSPAAGANITLPGKVSFSVNASDSDGSIAQVEFYVDGAKVGESTTAPYTFDWTAITGSYSVYALALDNAGASVLSNTASVNVINPNNIAPAVAITSPVAGTFNLTSQTITADASDLDGLVTKVEFFDGSTKLGEDTTAPYTFDWSGISYGSHALTAKAYDNDGGSTISSTVNFVTTKLSQVITFPALVDKNYGDAPFDVNATGGGSTTPVVFSIVSGPATISGSTVTITAAGSVVVRASQAGDATYLAATDVDRTFTVAKAEQVISFAALADKAYGDAPFTVSATGGGSGSAVTFSIVSGPATISGSTVTVTGSGSVIVRASQAGDSNYLAATDVDRSFNVTKAGQGITFAALPDKTFGASPFGVTATGGGSSAPVLFSIVSGPATISGSTVTITGAGSVVVRASQAGDANHSAASDVDRSFNVAKGTQSITFSAVSDKTFGDAAFDLSATGGASAQPVVFSVVSGPATISGTTVTLTGAGSVTVRASQIGDSNYLPAPDVDRSFNVAKAAQGITFNALADKTFGDAPFAVSATGGGSAAPLVFTIVSGPATLSGNMVTVTGAGSVTVRASQAGDANHAAATDVDRAFTVAKAAQSITFSPVSDKTFGDAPFDLSATGGASAQPVVFSVVSGPATISGATVTLTGAGSVTVRASQIGDSNYLPALDVDRSFNVAKAAQGITFNALADKTFGDAPFAVSATGGASTAPVTFSIVSGPATLSGNTVTLTGAGSVTVRASQAGDPNHAAATDVDRSFTVAKSAQTLTFDSSVPATSTVSSTVTLAATSNHGLTPITFSVVSGPGSITGSALTFTAPGAVIVQADQAGDANYLAATAQKTITANTNAPTITVPPHSKIGVIGQPVSFTVTAVGSGTLTYQWKRNSVNIPNAKSSSYTIPVSSAASIGQYTVEVKNAVGTALSDPAELLLVDATAKTLSLAPGGTATMNVVTYGTGLSFAWSKGGVPLVDSTRVLGSNTSRLTVKLLARDDAGNYTCAVSKTGVGSHDGGINTLTVSTMKPELASIDTLPDGAVGKAYSYQVQTQPDQAGQTKTAITKYAAGGLPAGLTINSTGLISGTPTVAYTNRTVTITATNDAGSSLPETCTITVLPLPANAVGTFVGRFERTAVNGGVGGRLDLTTTTLGTFTARLSQLGVNAANSVVSTGKLTSTVESGVVVPTGVVTFARSSGSPLSLSFAFDTANNAVTGTLTDPDTAGTASLTGLRNVWNAKTNAASAYSGYYTLALDIPSASVGDASIPQGNGFGNFTVADGGTLTLTGKTADGLAIAAATIVGPAGQLVVYSPVVATGGSLIGTPAITSDAVSGYSANTIAGELSWSKAKPASAADRTYKAGFGPLAMTVAGGKYTPPTAGEVLMGLNNVDNNAKLSFTLGGLLTGQSPVVTFSIRNLDASGTTQTVTLPVAGSTANPARTTFVLAVTPKGQFSGVFTVKTPGVGLAVISRAATYGGSVVRQGSGYEGFGYFLLPQLPGAGETAATAPILSGQVSLERAP